MRGRITGCPTAGDWWVRVMPMFGVFRDFLPHEGYVSPKDGSFTVSGSMRGERHLVAIGRGREALKVLGFDVVEGGRNDVGVIDLSTVCSK
jgi:hypothetical protein